MNPTRPCPECSHGHHRHCAPQFVDQRIFNKVGTLVTILYLPCSCHAARHLLEEGPDASPT